MSSLLAHWRTLLAPFIFLILLRVWARRRSRKREWAAWQKERERLQKLRKKEQQEEADRQKKAAQDRIPCLTEEAVAKAIARRAATIVIEGPLAQGRDSEILQGLPAEYQITVARHGKLVLKSKARASRATEPAT